jgi:cystathionine beta-lyase
MDPILGACDLVELRQRKSWKWRTHPADVLPAFVAEMDFDVAEPIKEAIRRALDLGDLGYPHPVEFGEAYAGFSAARFGWAPRPELVFAVPDVMTGIAEILTALTRPGEAVLIDTPAYPPHRFRYSLIGRETLEIELLGDVESGFRLDTDRLEATLARPEVAAYVMCNPHNPTGTAWDTEQLTAVADACQRHGKLLIVDEIHSPLALPGTEFVPFLSLGHEAGARSVVLTSASKGWNIPGLKCGVLIAGSETMAEVARDRAEPLLASHLGVQATEAAFRDCGSWLDAAVAQLDENRQALASLIKDRLPAVRYTPPSAGFLGWLDFRGVGLAEEPAQRLLTVGKVALNPGLDFGSHYSGFARLNFGTSPEILRQIVARVERGING